MIYTIIPFFLRRLFWGLALFLFITENTIAKEIKSLEKLKSLFNNATQAYSSGELEKAVFYWNEITKSEAKDSQLEPKKLATVYENLASVERHLGNPEQAIWHWQESIDIYTEQQDSEPTTRLHLAALLIDQSQAYNDLGQSRFSIPRLKDAIAIIQAQPSPQTPEQVNLNPMAFFALGNAFSIQGDYSQAIKAYQQSTRNLSQINPQDTLLAVSIWHNLSQTYQQRASLLKQKAIAAEIEEDPKATSLFQQATRDRLLALQTVQKAVKIGHNSPSIEQAKALIQLSKLANNHQRNRQTS